MAEEKLRVGRVHRERNSHSGAISCVKLIETRVKAVTWDAWTIPARLCYGVVKSMKREANHIVHLSIDLIWHETE